MVQVIYLFITSASEPVTVTCVQVEPNGPNLNLIFCQVNELNQTCANFMKLWCFVCRELAPDPQVGKSIVASQLVQNSELNLHPRELLWCVKLIKTLIFEPNVGGNPTFS